MDLPVEVFLSPSSPDRFVAGQPAEDHNLWPHQDASEILRYSEVVYVTSPSSGEESVLLLGCDMEGISALVKPLLHGIGLEGFLLCEG